MVTVPTKHFDRGFLNCVVHSLTGAQILYYLIVTWKDNPNQPMILWCKSGDAVAKANAVRVALSKERKARGVPRTFTLKVSEAWPATHHGIKGESIKIERTPGNQLTQMRAALHKRKKSKGITDDDF